MYAVFENGGKQYQVFEGQHIFLEKINMKIGEIVEFNQILIIFNEKNIEIGKPIIPNKILKATIMNHIQTKKIQIIKFNRRKHYRKKQGHRQWLTCVKIMKII